MKFTPRLTPFAVAVLLAGCGTLPPPSGTIAGRDAASAVVIVPRKQDVKIRDGRIFQFPAGHYAALEDDGDGIYFESPEGILIDDVFLGASIQTNVQTGWYLPDTRRADRRATILSHADGSRRRIGAAPLTTPVFLANA